MRLTLLILIAERFQWEPVALNWRCSSSDSSSSAGDCFKHKAADGCAALAVLFPLQLRPFPAGPGAVPGEGFTSFQVQLEPEVFAGAQVEESPPWCLAEMNSPQSWQRRALAPWGIHPRAGSAEQSRWHRVLPPSDVFRALIRHERPRKVPHDFQMSGTETIRLAAGGG